MRKSIILALCVLGVAQISHSFELTTAINVWKSMKEYFHVTKSVGEFIDALKHLDTTGELKKTFPNMGDIAKEIKGKALKLITHEDLWGALGDDAIKKLHVLAASILLRISNHKVKRGAKDKKELSKEDLDTMSAIIDDMTKNGLTESKLQRLTEMVTNMKNGSKMIKESMKSKSVKRVWQFVCDKAREIDVVPPKGVPKDKKTISYKMCSETTFAKMELIVKKGYKFVKWVFRLLMFIGVVG